LSGGESAETQIASPQPPEQRLCCSQEDLCGLSHPRAMYEEQVWSNDQATFTARRTGQDAGGESFSPGKAGHQNQAASDGAFFCQRDVVWF